MLTGPPEAVQAQECCDLLNTWVGYEAWRYKQANIPHEDAFGHQVAAGEYYLMLQEGGAHYARRKLALRSARTIWEIILTDNGKEAAFRKHLADQAEADQAKIRAAQTAITQAIG